LLGAPVTNLSLPGLSNTNFAGKLPTFPRNIAFSIGAWNYRALCGSTALLLAIRLIP
jgi:hypothetical protein